MSNYGIELSEEEQEAVEEAMDIDRKDPPKVKWVKDNAGIPWGIDKEDESDSTEIDI